MITIAIADDHHIVRKGIINIINSFPEFQVIIEASNGSELLHHINETGQLPQVCVLDVNMPVMNGFETLRALKKQGYKMPCLALSMYDNEFSIIQMFSRGAKGYLLKDCDPLELENALRTVHEGRFYNPDFTVEKEAQLSHIRSGLHKITEREIKFLTYCCSDYTYKEIADIMGVSPRTVEGYRDMLFHKLGIKNRTSLAIFALKSGLASTM